MAIYSSNITDSLLPVLSSLCLLKWTPLFQSENGRSLKTDWRNIEYNLVLKLLGNLLSGVHYDVVQAHQILHLIQSPGKIDAGKQFFRVERFHKTWFRSLLITFAHLSLPLFNGWVALSFLVCLFVCRPAMVTCDQISTFFQYIQA